MNAYAGGTSRAERVRHVPPQPNDIPNAGREAEFMPTGFSIADNAMEVFLILNIGSIP